MVGLQALVIVACAGRWGRRRLDDYRREARRGAHKGRHEREARKQARGTRREISAFAQEPKEDALDVVNGPGARASCLVPRTSRLRAPHPRPEALEVDVDDWRDIE